MFMCMCALKGVLAFCSVVQCVTAHCNVLQSQRIAMCCNMLQCVGWGATVAGFEQSGCQWVCVCVR